MKVYIKVYNRGHLKTNTPQLLNTVGRVLTSVRMITMANLSIPRTSGIYKITCLPTGKIYIGSAVNLRKRLRNHFSALRRNNHANRYLQSAWNKYGETNFTVEIVETIVLSSLLDREQYWLDLYRSYDRTIGFNISKCAEAFGRGLTAHNKGKSPSDETKSKLRSANIGKRASLETKTKMSASQKGKRMSDSAVAKTAAAHEKLWFVVSPTGIEMLIKNLSNFCIENNLNRGNMISVAQGKRPHNKGWKCRYA